VTANQAGWLLLAFAVALIVVGAPQAALLVALAAVVCAIGGAPTAAQRDSRKRNPRHARRVR
jgi:hypothetical protein